MKKPNILLIMADQFRGDCLGINNHPDVKTPHMLAEELANGGYYTQAVGKMHVHPLRNNCGFHNVELHDGCLPYYRRVATPYYENQRIADDYIYWLKNKKGVSADITDTGLECNSWVSRPWIYDEGLHPTNQERKYRKRLMEYLLRMS